MANDFIFFSTPKGGSSLLHDLFLNQFNENKLFIGVDWACDSGNNKGDVIKRDANVTYVRFKDLGI
ncbi:MAG: hypothetical protein AB9Q19_12680 [Candidatus Reddybacter sp.]